MSSDTHGRERKLYYFRGYCTSKAQFSPKILALFFFPVMFFYFFRFGVPGYPIWHTTKIEKSKEILKLLVGWRKCSSHRSHISVFLIRFCFFCWKVFAQFWITLNKFYSRIAQKSINARQPTHPELPLQSLAIRSWRDVCERASAVAHACQNDIAAL